MIDWSLDCEYFHIVFTLPHTLWSADLRQCEASKNGLPFAPVFRGEGGGG